MPKMIRISMQFFAEPDNNSSNGSDDNKNQDNPQNQDNSGQQQNNANDNQNQDQTQQNPEPKFDFMKELGMSEDDIKKLISNKHEEDEKNKTAEVKLAEATAKAAKAEAKVAAMQLGVKPTAVDDVIAIARQGTLKGRILRQLLLIFLNNIQHFLLRILKQRRELDQIFLARSPWVIRKNLLAKDLHKMQQLKPRVHFSITKERMM